MSKQVPGKATPQQIKQLWALIQRTDAPIAYTSLGMLTPAEAAAKIAELSAK